MIAKKTTRYILNFNDEKEMEEAEKFATRVELFYSMGADAVRNFHGSNFVIIEYDHYIETEETIFGGE